MMEQITTVTINPIPPIVDFDFGPGEGCAPLTVTFTNLTMYADPSTYQWDFGDGVGTSTQVNPSYTYYEPGIYSVTLSASNASGVTVYETKTDIINVFTGPSALFSVKPRLLYLPEGKLYTNNMSYGADTYEWDFGDGEKSTDFEPEHAYEMEGTYTIKLVASNEEGCSDTTKLESGVIVKNSGRVLIPNAFSPNLSGPGSSGAEGQNDVFIPILNGATDFEMLVFNRWGELMFETHDLDHGWDGYYRGQICAQDVYVYKIKAKFADGNVVTRVGDINLLR
jgi:gliding motility-associated-like protein